MENHHFVMGQFTMNDETIDNYWLVVLTILKHIKDILVSWEG
jgi:hypothetical protein